MRFYDAVVKGCEIAPNRTGFVYIDRASACACTAGAAALGVGCNNEYWVGKFVSAAFPFLRQPAKECPACSWDHRDEEKDLLELCSHMTLHHADWSREQIALFLSQFEPEPVETKTDTELVQVRGRFY